MIARAPLSHRDMSAVTLQKHVVPLWRWVKGRRQKK